MSEQIKSELLFCILRSQHQTEEILKGLMEIGIPGASVINSQGMAKILSEQLPVFGGFKNMFAGAAVNSQVIMSLIPENLLDDAIELIEESCEHFEAPDSGILFTLPVNRVMGLKRKLK